LPARKNSAIDNQFSHDIGQSKARFQGCFLKINSAANRTVTIEITVYLLRFSIKIRLIPGQVFSGIRSPKRERAGLRGGESRLSAEDIGADADTGHTGMIGNGQFAATHHRRSPSPKHELFPSQHRLPPLNHAAFTFCS
jgi:hypothetical protein